MLQGQVSVFVFAFRTLQGTVCEILYPVCVCMCEAKRRSHVCTVGITFSPKNRGLVSLFEPSANAIKTKTQFEKEKQAKLNNCGNLTGRKNSKGFLKPENEET